MPRVGEDLSREQRLSGQKRLTESNRLFWITLCTKTADFWQEDLLDMRTLVLMLFACCVTQ